MIYSIRISIAALFILTGCSLGVEQPLEQNQRAVPIDTTTKKADATFISPNVPQAGLGEADIGKLYWYLKDKIVLDDDVQNQLIYCEDDRFLICVESPLPLLLPKILDNFVYEVGSTRLAVKVQEYVLYEETCNFDSLSLEVISPEYKNYRFIISKKMGLLYYSVSSPDGLLDRELLNLSGNVFAFEDKC